MADLVVHSISLILIGAGVFFYMAGTVGLLRLTDIFSRLHALTKADNLGLGLIVLGLLPQVATLFDALQLVVIWLLVMTASAASCSLIARFAKQSYAADDNTDGTSRSSNSEDKAQ